VARVQLSSARIEEAEIGVRTALRIHQSAYLGFAMLLVACQHAPPPPYLPGHPVAEMFPRASSPPSNCPGQYRMTMESHSGDIFMGCWGHKTD
jgi:hypothetical protein